MYKYELRLIYIDLPLSFLFDNNSSRGEVDSKEEENFFFDKFLITKKKNCDFDWIIQLIRCVTNIQ